MAKSNSKTRSLLTMKVAALKKARKETLALHRAPHMKVLVDTVIAIGEAVVEKVD